MSKPVGDLPGTRASVPTAVRLGVDLHRLVLVLDVHKDVAHAVGDGEFQRAPYGDGNRLGL